MATDVLNLQTATEVTSVTIIITLFTNWPNVCDKLNSQLHPQIVYLIFSLKRKKKSKTKLITLDSQCLTALVLRVTKSVSQV